VFEIVVLGLLLMAASGLAYVTGRTAGRRPGFSQKRRRIAELTAERNGLRREVESLRAALSEARAAARPPPAAPPSGTPDRVGEAVPDAPPVDAAAPDPGTLDAAAREARILAENAELRRRMDELADALMRQAGARPHAPAEPPGAASPGPAVAEAGPDR
jgi:hypothetical protein